MAKLRKPSQRSIDLYNQLVAQQNKVRKTLRRIHKQAEEALGAGRLPALVIPKSSHKIRRNYFEGISPAELSRRLKAFWGKMAELKSLFSKGLKTYLAKTVKNGYMDLWLDQIEKHSGERPEAFNGYLFSKEQIENSEYGDFMTTYNRLFMLSPESFLALLYTGRMIAFKYIYREMEKVGRGDSSGSWLEEQNDLLNLKGIKIDGKDVNDWLKSIRSHRGMESTLKEAEEQGEAKGRERAYKTGEHGRPYKSKLR